MKRLVLAVLLLSILAGCGSSDYVEPQQAKSKVDRAMEIAYGGKVPTAKDYEELDVAPTINGVSSPDGLINAGDIVLLIRNISQPQLQ